MLCTGCIWLGPIRKTSSTRKRIFLTMQTLSFFEKIFIHMMCVFENISVQFHTEMKKSPLGQTKHSNDHIFTSHFECEISLFLSLVQINIWNWACDVIAFKELRFVRPHDSMKTPFSKISHPGERLQKVPFSITENTTGYAWTEGRNVKIYLRFQRYLYTCRRGLTARFRRLIGLLILLLSNIQMGQKILRRYSTFHCCFSNF